MFKALFFWICAICILMFSTNTRAETIAEVCRNQRVIGPTRTAGELNRSLCELIGNLKGSDEINLARNIVSILTRVGEATLLKKDTLLSKNLDTELRKLQNRINENQKTLTAPTQDPAFRRYMNLTQMHSIGTPLNSGYQSDLIVSLDRVLQTTNTGGRTLACYNSEIELKSDRELNRGALSPEIPNRKTHPAKTIALNINFSRVAKYEEALIFDTPPILETTVKFDTSINEKEAAGLFHTEEIGEGRGLRKVLVLNPDSFQDPIMFLLVYAHEMQHGCNLRKKYQYFQINQHYLGMNNPCANPFATDSKKCSAFEMRRKSAKDFIEAQQEGIIDELRSFRLMADLFKELAIKNPAICKNYLVNQPAGFFSDGQNIVNNGEFWSSIETKIQNGSFQHHVATYYIRHGYFGEALFTNFNSNSSTSPSTLNLRNDFKLRLKENGFPVEK